MKLEALQKFCRSLPHAKADVKWEQHLTFLIGGKMFAITDLDRGSKRVTLKSTPEEFAELIEQEGIVPAAYLARSHWITVERADRMRDEQLKQLVRRSYEVIKAKLPKRTQAKLQ
jgi:predicted DNA-binding protein (MmcQ/YjbR family)